MATWRVEFKEPFSCWQAKSSASTLSTRRTHDDPLYQARLPLVRHGRGVADTEQAPLPINRRPLFPERVRMHASGLGTIPRPRPHHRKRTGTGRFWPRGASWVSGLDVSNGSLRASEAGEVAYATARAMPRHCRTIHTTSEKDHRST